MAFRSRALAALGTIIALALGVVVMDAPAASADSTVHTLVASTPESWAPYLGQGGDWLDANVTITISCYVTGQSVTGPYGAETVWDMVSGGANLHADPGMFVPDADIWTGSNSPVVPRCATVLGTAIGDSLFSMYSGPGYGNTWLGSVAPGEQMEIVCYTTGESVTGPYGTENIWDRLTVTYFAPQVFVPDALIYTGSNSAVVRHC